MKNNNTRLRQSTAAASRGGGPRDILTNVLVWGLNDKDQLGGPKGSKVHSTLLLSLSLTYLLWTSAISLLLNHVELRQCSFCVTLKSLFQSLSNWLSFWINFSGGVKFGQLSGRLNAFLLSDEQCQSRSDFCSEYNRLVKEACWLMCR